MVLAGDSVPAGTTLVIPGLDRHFRLWVNLLACYHFLQLVSRNSGKGSLTSRLAWGPRMPEQRYGRGAVKELRAMEACNKTKQLLPIMLAFVKQQC